MAKSKDEYLTLVYDAKSNDDLIEGYDGWADSYDSDLDALGYRQPALLACLTSRYVLPDDGVVLDVGAGTGLVGEWLNLAGFKAISGMDLSAQMLAIAKQRNVYQDLRQMALGGMLDYPDNSFRAIVAAGVFNASHAPPSSFDELVRITKPDGHLIFTVKQEDIEPAGFQAKFDELETRNIWRKIEIVGPYIPMLNEPKITASIFIYQAIK